MNRVLQIGSILLLAVGASVGKQKEPKESPPPPPPKIKPVAPKAGTPKALQKGAQRVVNPGNVATRLFHMTPEERERVIDKLPPQQQLNVRNLLAWFDSLPKETQELQIRRIERFEQLPPQRKAEVKQLTAEVNQLPPPRKQAVGQALARLQRMTDEEREATLRKPAFLKQFSLEEIKIIIGLSDAWMGPQ
jgi:hypothetical protein